jgi:hypothetical protein
MVTDISVESRYLVIGFKEKEGQPIKEPIPMAVRFKA